MDLIILEKQYNKCVLDDNADDIFDFIDMLMEDNSDEVLEFHYSLLSSENDSDLYKHIRISFKKRKESGKVFLLKKLNEERNEKLIAESLHILGNMRCQDVLEYCYKYINHREKDLRYRSIIVLGWVGEDKDIDLLEDHLYSEQETNLTGYCATAMRQIWFRIPETKDKILKIYKEALEKITNQEVWPYILICLQDLLKMKLGIKEDAASMHFKGDIAAIKEKTIKKIDKYFADK